MFKSRVSFRESTREIFANNNFRFVVLTGLVHMAIYSAIEPFTTLYLRDIGISYLRIGYLDAICSLFIIPSVLVGSYLSDLLSHRRSRFAAANCCCWGVMCIIYSMVGHSRPWSAMVVFVIAGLSYTFHAPSRAYMLDQSPQDNHHTAMAFFSLYRLPMLLVFCALLWLFKVYGFIIGMRLGLFLGGSVIVTMGLVRAFLLTDLPKDVHITREKPCLTGLIKDNGYILRYLIVVAPAFVIITFLDSFSDCCWSFLIYFILNEQAGLSASEILQGRLTIDLLSIPVILYLAFRINKSNGRKAFFLLYLVIPIAVGLLILSRSYPNIPFVPDFIPFANVAFLAYCLKYIQDFLWLHILLTPVAMLLVPKEHSTKAIGISWLLANLSRLIGSPLAGWVYQSYTNGSTILLGGILVLNFLILITILTLDCDLGYNSPPNGESRPRSK